MKLEVDNAFQAIREMPSGTMLFGGISKDQGKSWMSSLYVKDDMKYIDTLGEKPLIYIRSGMIIKNDVGIVVLILNVNKNPNMYYETWYNYCTEQGKDNFEYMSEQNELPIYFINEFNNPQRSVAINNTLTKAFKDCIKNILPLKPWSMDDFDKAREEVYKNYPTIMDLWNALGSKLGEK